MKSLGLETIHLTQSVYYKPSMIFRVAEEQSILAGRLQFSLSVPLLFHFIMHPYENCTETTSQLHSSDIKSRYL